MCRAPEGLEQLRTGAAQGTSRGKAFPWNWTCALGNLLFHKDKGIRSRKEKRLSVQS